MARRSSRTYAISAGLSCGIGLAVPVVAFAATLPFDGVHEMVAAGAVPFAVGALAGVGTFALSAHLVGRAEDADEADRYASSGVAGAYTDDTILDDAEREYETRFFGRHGAPKGVPIIARAQGAPSEEEAWAEIDELLNDDSPISCDPTRSKDIYQIALEELRRESASPRAQASQATASAGTAAQAGYRSADTTGVNVSAAYPAYQTGGAGAGYRPAAPYGAANPATPSGSAASTGNLNRRVMPETTAAYMALAGHPLTPAAVAAVAARATSGAAATQTPSHQGSGSQMDYAASAAYPISQPYAAAPHASQAVSSYAASPSAAQQASAQYQMASAPAAAASPYAATVAAYRQATGQQSFAPRREVPMPAEVDMDLENARRAALASLDFMEDGSRSRAAVPQAPAPVAPTIDSTHGAAGVRPVSGAVYGAPASAVPDAATGSSQVSRGAYRVAGSPSRSAAMAQNPSAPTGASPAAPSAASAAYASPQASDARARQQIAASESVAAADFAGHEDMWAQALSILADDEPRVRRASAGAAEGARATRMHEHVNHLLEDEFDRAPSQSARHSSHEYLRVIQGGTASMPRLSAEA